MDGRFETPLSRRARGPRLEGEDERDGLEAWAARERAPWADPRAERTLSTAAFYLTEAQRDPGRRPGKHLLRMLSLVRVRVGFFRLPIERRAVEASALVRTGRPRGISRGE
jgi:hypothetical protein